MASKHWYAIKHKPSNRSIAWVGPSLVTIEEGVDIIYWGSGPSYMPVHDWDKEIQIVKDYGEIDDMAYHAIDDLYDQFTLDFPPEAELKISGGWLAPDGKFYPCAYMDHLNEAQDLAFVHYKERGDGEQHLEKKGWAKIFSDGTCILLGTIRFDDDLNDLYPNMKYTQTQLDTLGDLFVLATAEEAETYAKNIKRELGVVEDLGD